jgi:protein-disulfide isomerase
MLAAEAVECANEQGKFWEYYEKVYQNQSGENAGTNTVDSLTHLAGEVPGLDTAQLRSPWNRASTAASAAGDQHRRSKNIQSTPAGSLTTGCSARASGTTSSRN